MNSHSEMQAVSHVWIDSGVDIFIFFSEMFSEIFKIVFSEKSWVKIAVASI